MTYINFILLTSHFSPPQLHQLRPQHELRADSLVVLVRPTRLGVGPGEPLADRGIIRLSVDGAHVVLQEDATTSPHPGSPFSPAGPIDRGFPMDVGDGDGLLLAQSDAVRTTGGAMGTGKAWQRWQLRSEEHTSELQSQSN